MLGQGDSGIEGQPGSQREDHSKANPLEAEGKKCLASTRALVSYSSRIPDKRYENVDSLENFRGSQLVETLFSPRLKGTLLGRQDSSRPGQTFGQK